MKYVKADQINSLLHNSHLFKTYLLVYIKSIDRSNTNITKMLRLEKYKI